MTAILSLRHLRGSLIIDFHEEVKIQLEPKEYKLIELNGGSLNLSSCSIKEALSYLKYEYAVRKLTAKIITSKPFSSFK